MWHMGETHTISQIDVFGCDNPKISLIDLDVPTPVDTITVLCSTEFSWSSHQVKF